MGSRDFQGDDTFLCKWTAWSSTYDKHLRHRFLIFVIFLNFNFLNMLPNISQLLTKTEGGSLRWLKRRAYEWSPFPVIIHGGKAPVLYYMTLSVKNWICLVFFKIPITLSFGRHRSSTHSRWKKRAAGNPLPISVPDNSFWSILGKSVESCYNFILVCQFSFSVSSKYLLLGFLYASLGLAGYSCNEAELPAFTQWKRTPQMFLLQNCLFSLG